MSKDMHASTDITTGGQSLNTKLEVSEKRRADAQAALTPLQQENARLKAELAAAKTPHTPDITPERQKELDDMKFTKPDEWRGEMNKIDKETQSANDIELARLTKVETDKQTVDTFFAIHPDIDKVVIKQIIPNAIQKRYEDGEITIVQVLEIGKKLLDGAPIASVLAPDSPKIGEVAGSDKPTNQAKQKQVAVDWTKALV